MNLAFMACPYGAAVQAVEPLEIAVVTDTWPPEVNGVAMTMSRLVRGLRARGHKVVVVRPQQADEPPMRVSYELAATYDLEVTRPSAPVPRYESLRMGGASRAFFEAGFRARRPDVVHLVTESLMGSGALKAARSLGIPATSGYHTNFHEFVRHYNATWLSAPGFAYLRWFHNRTAVTLAPSPQIQEDLLARGFERVELLARGVELDIFTPERRSETLRAAWGLRPNQLALIYVGRVAPEKNLTLAVRALRRIQTQDPDARLVFVGDGPAYDALAKEPGVIMAGVHRGESLATHYASGDLFLFPSLTDTFGNVYTEAMACGLPTVAFDYAAPALHGVQDVNTVKVPFGDEGAWLEAATALALDPDRRARLGAAARETMLPLGWDRISDRFASLLRRIVAA